MRRHTSLGLATFALLLAVPAGTVHAQTVLVDFAEYLSPVTTEYQATVGLPVTSKGFDFYETSLYNGANSRNVLGTWGTSDAGAVNRPVNVGSANTMFATTTAGVEIDIFPAGSDLVLGQVTNVFSMRSIDVAHLYSTEFAPFVLGNISLTFSGFGPGTSNATISQTFVIPPPPVVGSFRYPVLQTLTFDARWQNLVNVWWFQGTGSGTAHQFTNVVAYQGLVPEPGTYVLLATGLAVLGIAARRRPRFLA